MRTVLKSKIHQTYTNVPEEVTKDYRPKIVHVDEKNAIVTRVDEKIFA